MKLFFPEHIKISGLFSLDRTPAVFTDHKVLQVDANYGTTGTMDARCSDRQGRTCIGGPMHRLQGLYQILLV